ncbi:MAG TPA: hypothetical protein VGM96_19965 [Reyranella sp.]|jgi:hypothetical protein
MADLQNAGQKAYKCLVIIAIVGWTVASSCLKLFEIIGEFVAVSGLTGRSRLPIFRPPLEFTPARPGLFVEPGP